MHAETCTHGVLKEIKDFFYHHYYYPALHHILRVSMPLSLFDFHNSSVCRCFNIFHPHLPTMRQVVFRPCTTSATQAQTALSEAHL